MARMGGGVESFITGVNKNVQELAFPIWGLQYVTFLGACMLSPRVVGLREFYFTCAECLEQYMEFL